MLETIEKKYIHNPLNLTEEVLNKGKMIHDNIKFHGYIQEAINKSPLQLYDEGITWLKSLDIKKENEYNWRAWDLLGQKHLKRRQIEDRTEEFVVLNELQGAIHDILDCPETSARTWRRSREVLKGSIL